MKIIYINSGNSSVMEAQVLELLDYYLNHTNSYTIILVQGYKSRVEKTKIQSKLANYKNIPIKWFKTLPNYSFFNSSSIRNIKNIVLKECTKQNFIIHTRGEVYGSFIKQILLKNHLPLNLLVDIRGVRIEEIELYKQTNALLRWNKIFNLKKHYNILKEIPDTNITVVSEQAKNFLSDRYNFDKKNLCVHPNIAGKQFIYSDCSRTKIRKKYDIKENQLLAICSSGGGAAWQKDFEIIERLAKRGIKVINLSPNKIILDGVTSLQVPFKEMPAYLSAADIAVLWRDDNPVNNTASPSKMSEFATMGLYVIHNGSVGIATEFIKQFKSGIIISDVNEIDSINFSTINSENRKTWCKKGIEKYGIDNIAKSYITKYQQIINQDNK